MKLHLACLASLVVAATFTAENANAQHYFVPPPGTYVGPLPFGGGFAPDMCGPGFYCTNGCTYYGPSYNVYPPFPPFQGILPPMNNHGFPVNPFTRSPRDFFMWSDAQKSLHTREVRPPF